MSPDINGLCLEIENYTQLGHAKLECGETTSALHAFEHAYEHASQLNCECILKACEINLGVIYIYLEHPEKGLEHLKKALAKETSHQDETMRRHELHYHLGMAYLNLNDYQTAIEYLQMALEGYQKENSIAMMVEMLNKIGQALTKLNKKEEAILNYQKAVSLFGELGQVEDQAQCMLKYIKLQITLGQDNMEELQKCAALCRELCAGQLKGSLFNDLGLFYMQFQNHAEAAVVFEDGLAAVKGGEKKNEAVLYQNLGAAYNALGEFQKALDYHEAAVQIYASYGNRNAQGQCYFNLAFAASKLSDFESAWEAYLHATLAAKDSGDLHNEWQAYEGLGSVAFHQGKLDRAVQYFQKCLGIVSNCPEAAVNDIQQRIIGKLTHALRSQLAYNLKMAAADASYSTLLNSEVKSVKPKRKKKYKGRSVSEILMHGEDATGCSLSDSDGEDEKKKVSRKGGNGKKSKVKSSSHGALPRGSIVPQICSDLSDSDSALDIKSLHIDHLKNKLPGKDTDGLSMIPLMDATKNQDSHRHKKEHHAEGTANSDSLTDVTESDMETIRPSPETSLVTSSQHQNSPPTYPPNSDAGPSRRLVRPTHT